MTCICNVFLLHRKNPTYTFWSFFIASWHLDRIMMTSALLWATATTRVATKSTSATVRVGILIRWLELPFSTSVHLILNTFYIWNQLKEKNCIVLLLSFRKYCQQQIIMSDKYVLKAFLASILPATQNACK